MPYASSIQLVNDANGTGYAFLADNGLIWQCQWNAQAQQWDKAQPVPLASGGDKLQALYLDKLWPTSVAGVSGSNPGFVLAYKVGTGTGAEIVASLGQWSSSGELSWSQPVPLTNDLVEEQAFALVAGQQGGFSLVTQKQAPNQSTTALLAKFNSTPQAQLQSEVEAAASQERPDSDLYVSQFQLAPSTSSTTSSSAGTPSWTLTSPRPGGASPTVVGPVVMAPVQPPLAAAPLALGGNTQLSRQALQTPVSAPGGIGGNGGVGGVGSSGGKGGVGGVGGSGGNGGTGSVLGASSGGSSPSSGVSYQGGFGWQENTKNGGSLRFGLLASQDPMRWRVVLPRTKYTSDTILNLEDISEPYSDDRGDAAIAMAKNAATLVDGGPVGGSVSVANDAADLEGPGLGEALPLGRVSDGAEALDDLIPTVTRPNNTFSDAQLRLFWQGGFGLANVGQGGPTALSTAKAGIEYGNSSREKVANKTGIGNGDGFASSFRFGGGVNFGGALRTSYPYDNGWSAKLIGLNTAESISADFTITGIKRTSEGGSMTVQLASSPGYSFNQTVSSPNGGHLPGWLAGVGYAGGLIGDLEKKYYSARFTNSILKGRSGKGIASIEGDDNYLAYTKAQLAGLKTAAGSSDNDFSAIAAAYKLINAGVGTAMAALGPITARVVNNKGGSLGGAAFQNSTGIELFTRGAYRYLYKSLAGIQLAVADNYERFYTGAEKGTWQDTFFASAAVALPFGASVPLLSYLHTWKGEAGANKSSSDGTTLGATAAAATDAAGGSAPVSTSSKGVYRVTPTDGAYGFGYTPSTASSNYFAPAFNGGSGGTQASNPYLLASTTQPLLYFTLAAYQGVVNARAGVGSSPLTLFNAGSNLKPGSYTDVPLLGVTAEGSKTTVALASFTVPAPAADGSPKVAYQNQIDPSTFKITRGGNYLHLPETVPGSGIYALIPDVYASGIATPPETQAGALGNVYAEMPLITVDTSRTATPLSTVPIQRVVSIVVNAANQVSGVSYPRYEASSGSATESNTTGTSTAVPSNTNTPYTYNDQPVTLQAVGSNAAVTVLNPSALRATVHLSGGVIQRVELNHDLLVLPQPGVSQYTLQVSLPGAVQSAVTAQLSAEGQTNAGVIAAATTPTFAVTTQQVAYNNFVSDEQFSAQPGLSDEGVVNSGVYLAAGVSDQLPLYAAMGKWPVQNRVSYVTTTTTTVNGKQQQKQSVVYLNALQRNKGGGYTSYPSVSSSEWTPKQIYTDPDRVFSLASAPTVTTIEGASPSTSGPNPNYVGHTLVAWVEASDPVIPIQSSDGSQNYQDYLTAVYGNQRINYRIQSGSGWLAPNLGDLYYTNANAKSGGSSSGNVIIRHLKAYNVAKPGAYGDVGTLLVWSESSIDAIKGNVESLGSGTSVPTVIKTAWINPNPTSLQWSDLTKDATGQSTIQTIPWDPTSDVGLTIDGISIASMPVVQSDNSVRETPVVSWSQGVRTPYRQSVLDDAPLLYLQLGELQSGLNSVNLGSINDPSTTSTVASETGLNFAVPGALPVSQASAVQNVDGTGVLSTGLGSAYASITQVLSNVPASSLGSGESAIATFTGSIAGDVLTVSAISSGSLAVGDVISAAGVAAGSTIKAILNVNSNGIGTYKIADPGLNVLSQSVAASAMEAIPATPASGVMALFSGAISGNTLTVSDVAQGALQLGDVVVGEGVPAGTTITAVGAGTGGSSGSYTLSTTMNQPLAMSSLVAIPGRPTSPYALEFWVQLPSATSSTTPNPNGAGLVAFGQPSSAAVGAANLPQGWLLSSSFVVDRLTYAQVAAHGDAKASAQASAAIANGTDGSTFFGWGWGLVAQGADTTATDGTGGGSNLYSNALQITNLQSGAIAQGMAQFLANYQLSSSDLPGMDGTDASTMALVPTTQLQFDHSLNASNQPVSVLNGIAVDTSTSMLNRGVITDTDLNSNAKASQLNAMFQALWDFQQKTGEAKVNLSLPQGSSAVTTVSNGALPNATSSEQYQGYGLNFALLNGAAVSVNGAGQLVFDVGRKTSIATALPQSLNDGQWHYVVASYLPTYQAYQADGQVTQLPTNVGTASLYVDNQLAASQSNIIDAYAPVNLNDQALLLANNAGGAIDQFAFYDKALSSRSFSPNSSGAWPQPNADDALAVLAAMGYGIATKTPDPGAIPGAVSAHWSARTVNPNNAELATYYSTLTGSGWTQASNLNPSLAPQASATSASRSGSLQDDLIIKVPASNWLLADWNLNSGGSAAFFSPTGGSKRQLTAIAVTLTDTADSSTTTTFKLGPDQVLLGTQSLQSLQPLASSSNYQFAVPTNAPSFQLLIDKKELNKQLQAKGKSAAATSYLATYTFTFTDHSSSSTTSTTVTPHSGGVLLNVKGAAVVNSEQLSYANSAQLSTAQSYGSAIATAAVIEQAPLQLKYIDSGVVLKSAQTAAAANSPATGAPAGSFGQSQVYGFYGPSGGTQSGWLAIAQPNSRNASSDPAGRIWINYTGQFTIGTNSAGEIVHTAVKNDPSQAPSTWLNALANSNFSPDSPNLPLVGDALYPSSTGGLLIQADATVGWGQNLGQTMLVADVNQDGAQDLVLAAPQANGGGRVYIISGKWIENNLTTINGATILNLANPSELGDYVTVLSPSAVNSSTDNVTVAGFGSALAFDASSGNLLIGAPNYLRQFSTAGTSATELQALQPIGALYSYNPSSRAQSGSWGSGSVTPLTSPVLGTGGQMITLGSDNQPTISFWGSQLGTAIASNGNGGIAVSAPGVVAAMEYSGTKAVQESAVSGKKKPSDVTGDGALLKIGLPVLAAGGSNMYAVSSAGGTKNSSLIDIVNQTTTGKKKKLTSRNAAEESAYMQQLKTLQADNIANATLQYNQALQANAVGAVYVLNSGAGLQSLASGSATSGLSAAAVKGAGGATFYGAQPWNTLGASGFGSSLAFADLNNKNNTGSVLAIGAAQTGGPGALYLVDATQPFGSPGSTEWLNAINLGSNEYLAHLASGLTLYGEQSQDNFANGLINLGDANQDGYNDLAIQAFNASGGAGNGYVLFGSDNLFHYTTNSSDGSVLPNPATGSVAAGAAGMFTRADGSSFRAPMLTELGYGTSGYTGQGTFGSGDVNADGNADIPLGSATNGSAYLTWGHPYLKSINNLQLSRLTSDTGYMLDGLASATQGSLKSIGDFNGDGYGDFISVKSGSAVSTVRIELGANTQEILADYAYNFYSFTVANGTEVIAAGDVNGDGLGDLALFLDQNLSTAAEGNQGAGSTTGLLYGRPSSQLPIGSGFGLLAPVNPSSNAPLSPLPGVNVSGGLTNAAPAFINVGNTIYGVVQGSGSGDTSLWFAQSSDGGNSWSNWSNLSASNAAFAAKTGASLCFYNNKLYVAFVNTAGTLSLASWDPSSKNPTSWSTPVALAGFSSAYSPQLINRGDSLALVWVDAGSGTLYAASSTMVETDGWSPASQLQQRNISSNGTASFSSISATSAPTAAYLGAEPVLALNNGGSIKVYAGLPGGVSWQLASTFTAASGLAISSAPVLASTDTGVALTYTNSDSSINLQRLDLLSLAGAAREGVTFNSGGGFSLGKTDLLWQSTVLNNANAGLSTALPSVPLSVNGNLLLANVRNSASQNGSIWFNAIPNASDPASTTWLNSTVQLPDGNGGWSISQQAGSGVITPLAPSWTGTNGESGKAPSFAELNGVLYAVVQGTTQGKNNYIYMNASTDGGATWQANWTQLPGSWTTYSAPSLAVFGGSLYLCFLGENNNEINITSIAAPTANLSGFGNSANWSSLYQISGQTASFATLLTETVGGSQQLAVYYVSNDSTDRLLKTYTSTPASSSSWSALEQLQYVSEGSLSLQTQTSSGPLAAVQCGGRTYLAYQGGTTDSSSNTIYLTSSDAPNSGSSWRLVEGLPQASTGSHTGVGLSSDGSQLILSYADQSQNSQVLQLQRGTVSGNVWSGLLYNSIASPGGASSAATASVYVSGTGAPVLVGGINPNSSPSSDAIVTTLVSPLPASAVLTAAQSGSNLSAVGDLNGDGYGDLLVAANHVVGQSSSGQQLATGLRVIQGGPTSAAISSANASGANSQRVYLAPTNTLSSNAPVAAVSGSAQLTLSALTHNSSGRGVLQSSQIQVPASLQPASAGNLASAQLGATPVQSTGPLAFANSWGRQVDNSATSYGDLNGDGRPDYFDPAGNLAIDTGHGGVSLSLWSIQAAGDVNGNGIDDVLLALTPNGPSYGNNSTSGPNAIQSVLVDGSLFKVDATTNSFRLDQLYRSLDPFNRGESYDVGATATSQYTPLLQNWFEPIQTFKPGNLTAAATADGFNPAAAASMSAPSAAVDAQGKIYLLYSGNTNAGKGSGLWMAYQAASGSWSQFNLPVGSNACNFSPSATFYNGVLYVAYADVDGYVHIASSSTPETSSSWSSYQVVTTGSVDEKTAYSPTLVVEQGRLALYFPAAASSNGLIATLSQNLRYLYSRDPQSSSGWGSVVDAATGQFSGVSGVMNAVSGSGSSATTAPVVLSSSVAATSFQGKTVLACNTGSGTVQLLSAPSANPSADKAWLAFDTSITTANGIGLASDQGQLYLTVSTWGSTNPKNWTNATPQIWSATPAGSQGQWTGQWSLASGQTISGPGLPAFLYLSPSGGNSDSWFPALPANTVQPFFVKGNLYATWSGGYGSNVAGDFDVQLAQLNTTIDTPVQQSLAGYSLGGNIDANGDGFQDVLISDPSDPSKAIDNQYVLFGGDYLNLATQVGTGGNDTLLGTPLADVIYSIGGADVVSSGGGADVILTGAGDDQISIVGPGFVRVDGGSGFDQLLLNGQANQAYNFVLGGPSPEYFAGTKLKDIELISSLEYGANALSFDAAAVNAINPDRILFVTPDASDTINLSGEFLYNSAFNTNYQGVLWSAYAAAAATATPAADKPTLVYVKVPEGQTSSWLASHVKSGGVSLSSSRPASSAVASVSTRFGVVPEAGARPAAVVDQQTFGHGLSIEAFNSAPGDGAVRFVIHRSETSTEQVVSYVSTTLNSTADPNRDYKAVCGVLRFARGQQQAEVSVPFDAAAMAALRRGEISLQVSELQDKGQKPVHLVLNGASVEGAVAPVLSELQLAMDATGRKASLSFRSDTAQPAADYSLNVVRRSTANAPLDAITSHQEVEISDGDGITGDRDGKVNGQVALGLTVDLRTRLGGFTLQNSKPGGRKLRQLDTLLVSGSAEKPLLSFVDQVSKGNKVSGRLQIQIKGRRDVVTGVYRVRDASGTVLDGKGQELRPGEKGYLEAALRPANVINSEGLRGSASRSLLIKPQESNALLAPYVKLEGAVYVPFVEANTGGLGVLRGKSSSSIGFGDGGTAKGGLGTGELSLSYSFLPTGSPGGAFVPLL